MVARGDPEQSMSRQSAGRPRASPRTERTDTGQKRARAPQCRDSEQGSGGVGGPRGTQLSPSAPLSRQQSRGAEAPPVAQRPAPPAAAAPPVPRQPRSVLTSFVARYGPGPGNGPGNGPGAGPAMAAPRPGSAAPPAGPAARATAAAAAPPFESAAGR
ncbi:hypothetical protein DV515_00016118 [Chloebia gouldiae]|uniref:Uncharacterized protein n=1 Tax=Chloebia gouldiae TaxID=44316 RepID=A0A3L8RT99_CHLGU|nr:hypothetical protein DV515_00016118 [Chloebia gouldiae]